ncbi:uncharacterized protein LOC143076342 [Mytilus galloprovincialis]|uniref:uncharacterized protein LOC143076342 n=1 Tax=Mytilus galloprovincialis TaxID=29158 RepID=UPI003F7C9018
MKKDNVNIIFKSHLAEANKMNGDLALSDKQLDDFLLTQHALGKIMYFNQPELNNFIILYPPALVNILRSFVTDEIFWPEEETLRKILRNMTDTGKIYKEDLLKLWQQKSFHTHIPDDDFKEFVIQVLIHLDVLVLPKRYTGKSDVHLDYYLVPCTVKEKMQMSFLDDKSFSNRTIALVYRLQQSSIPSALSFKLIGAISGIWPIKELNDCPLLYHCSAVLCVDGQTELRIIVEDKRVIIYLTHESSKHFISPNIAASIQECLTLTLEAVLTFYLSSVGKSYRKMNVSNLFQIEIGEICDRSPCVVSISKAVKALNWVCDKGINHDTKCSRLWFFDKAQKECKSNCTGLDKTVLTKSPTDKHLARLAKQLSIIKCKELVLYLGIEETEWEEIEYVYQKQPLIMKFMALKEQPSKSFNDLLKAQEDIKDGRHLLCKVFREDTGLVDIADVRLQEIPHDDVLNGLSKHLGNCAILLGIELGITITSIDETMTRHPRDMYLQIEDILRKWKSSRKVKPTIYRLMLAVERVYSGGLSYLKDIYLGQ